MFYKGKVVIHPVEKYARNTIPTQTNGQKYHKMPVKKFLFRPPSLVTSGINGPRLSATDASRRMMKNKGFLFVFWKRRNMSMSIIAHFKGGIKRRQKPSYFHTINHSLSLLNSSTEPGTIERGWRDLEGSPPPALSEPLAPPLPTKISKLSILEVFSLFKKSGD